MRAINQQLLADTLNLSRTTVSRSLANHPAISADTRSKVQNLAIEMGYMGNATRRTGRKNAITIGVIIDSAETASLSAFPLILQGIQEKAETEHVAVDVCFQDPATLANDEKRPGIFRSIRSGDWRGAILVFPFPEQTVQTIAHKISTVAVLERYNHPHVDTIDTDDLSGISELVHRLHHAGHRRIGYSMWRYPIGGHWGLRRFSGYVEALYALGLDFNPEWALNVRQNQSPLSPTQISQEVERRVKQDGVTAWVCAADHQAYALIRDLQVAGIRVPQDCSVTGFDGLDAPPDMPQAASMRVPHVHIGASAVARLLSRMMNPNSPRRKILVEAETVEGATIGRRSPA